MSRVNYKKEGNRFHQKLAQILKKAGFRIEHSDFNAKGPDIIVEFNKVRIIIQCRHSPNNKYYQRLNEDIDSYAHKIKKFKADRAVLALSGYKHHKFADKKLHDWLVEDGVAIWPDAMIQNYDALVKSIGRYAVYQILGDLGVDAKFGVDVDCDALEVRQHKTSYYLSALPAGFLLKSSYVARRAQKESFYQRYLSRKRVFKEIPDFIEHQKGIFPNNLILVSRDRLSFSKGRLKIPSSIASFWVVDGQHRLYSFANVKDKNLLEEYMLGCSVFDGTKLSSKEQAEIFLKINTQAKKAPAPLIVDLARSFSFDYNHRGISLLGLLEKTPYFCDRIRNYTDRDGDIDGNTFSMSAALNELIKDNGGIIWERRVQYTENKKVKLCYKYLHTFFKVINTYFGNEWRRSGKYVLCTNQGYRALLRLFGKILKYTDYRLDETKIRVVIRAFRDSSPLIKVEDVRGKYAGEGGALQLANEWAKGINNIIPGFDRSVSRGQGDIIEEIEVYRREIQKAEEFLHRGARLMRGIIRAELMHIDATTIAYLKQYFPETKKFHVIFSDMRRDDKRKIDSMLKDLAASGKSMILTKCPKNHERVVFDSAHLLDLGTDLKKDAIANNDHKVKLWKFNSADRVEVFDSKWDHFKRFEGREIVYNWSLMHEDELAIKR